MVHASVREQFGQVLVEAMACGVPPIAVDRGGPANIVDSGRTGWLVEPDDAESLGQAMVEAVNDPEERRARGASACGEAAAAIHLERDRRIARRRAARDRGGRRPCLLGYADRPQQTHDPEVMSPGCGLLSRPRESGVDG